MRVVADACELYHRTTALAVIERSRQPINVSHTLSAVARASDSQLRESGFELMCCSVRPWEGFHSTLLQFTQLYEQIPGYRYWWIFVRAASRINCSVAGLFPEKLRWYLFQYVYTSAREVTCKGLDTALWIIRTYRYYCLE